jgi:hypothetical protein
LVLIYTDISGYNNDEIVDTDWTNTVSSEGLAPGETTEFYTYNENWTKNITATVKDFIQSNMCNIFWYGW